MKRINPDTMSKAELDRLGAEAEKVTFDNSRPLTEDARQALTRAASRGRTSAYRGWFQADQRYGGTKLAQHHG
jgi:hypothetical protein